MSSSIGFEKVVSNNPWNSSITPVIREPGPNRDAGYSGKVSRKWRVMHWYEIGEGKKDVTLRSELLSEPTLPKLKTSSLKSLIYTERERTDKLSKGEMVLRSRKTLHLDVGFWMPLAVSMHLTTILFNVRET